jgi:hypothetical protein
MSLHNVCDSLQKLAVETAVIFFERYKDKPGAVTKKRDANCRQTITENIYEENAIPLFPIL